MSKKIYIPFMFTVVLAIVILATGCATLVQLSGPSGGFPVSQCVSLVEREGENISIKFKSDPRGCIKEQSVEFYRSTNCTGDIIEHEFQNPSEDFIFVSGTRGGCPQIVEVTTNSPTCVTLTLKSGRETEVCW